MGRKLTNKQRGYTSRWDRLSRQGRAHARFCALCGKPFTPDDPASTDHIDPLATFGPHLPTLDRVQVVHRSCNSRRARELERAQPEASPKRWPTRPALFTGKPGHRVWWGATGDVAPPSREDPGRRAGRPSRSAPRPSPSRSRPARPGRVRRLRSPGRAARPSCRGGRCPPSPARG
jgi:hypothetical protein